MKNVGWIKLHRKICNNSLWFLEPFTKAQAWVDLILNANHKDAKISIRGNILDVKRGQLCWSEITMSKRWKWSRNKVRRFLEFLKNDSQIGQQKTSITSIITIVCYEEYQQHGTTDDTTERRQEFGKSLKNGTTENLRNYSNDNYLLQSESVERTTDDTTERQRKRKKRYTNKNDFKNDKNKKYISASSPLSELQILWNELCTKLNKVRSNSNERHKTEQIRLRERSVDEWREVFNILNNSEWCCGNNKDNWKATYDWVMKNNKNSQKILEGNYNRNSGSGGIRAETEEEGRQRRKREAF
ncbi:MAG: hypothetical protein MRK02_05620 [Candidatus Scalindua sp.]|nr:hypothetical protein [Candidatus Scalindua sp.]